MLRSLRPTGATRKTWNGAHDYSRARQEALDKSRPLLINFGTETCFWCKKLDAGTFVDPEIRGLLNERFIPLKIDANRNADLAEKLNIRNYPTLVFASADGRILGYQEGFLEAAEAEGAAEQRR